MPPSPLDLLKKVQGGSISSPLFSSSPSSSASSAPSPSVLLSKAQPAAPSFGSALFGAAKKIVSSVAGAVGNFAKTSAQNLIDASPLSDSTHRITVSPSDVLAGIGQTAAGIGNLAKGFNEGILRIGTSIEAALPGGKQALDAAANNGAASGLLNDITGETKTTTYQDLYSRAHSYAINNNATPDQAKVFGGLTVIGSLFADNPVVGPEGEAAKGLFTLSEDAVKTLAKETDETVIKDVLKTANPGLNDTQLEALAPVFKHASTDEEVKTAASQIQKIQDAKITEAPEETPAASTAPAEDLPAPEEVQAAAEKNLHPPEELPKAPEEEAAPDFQRAVEGDETGPKFEPVQGEPVKIADGVDTFIHQPENGAFEVMEAKTGRLIGKAAGTAEEAVQSAREALAGKTPEEIQATIDQHPAAPRAGSAPTPREPGAPLPFDQRVVRSISEEDLPGPISDILRGQFPSLSDQALGPIAKRLSQLHRTGDIEGILQVVRNIERDISTARGGAKAVRGSVDLTAETVGPSIAKVAAKRTLGDLPGSIGELFTDAERGRYLENVQRSIKDKETAVLAQQEYDALWNHADQRIIDRYEELRLQRDLARDALSNHVGAELNKLYHGTFTSPKDVHLSDLVASNKGKGFDTRIDEITGRTGGEIDDAQKELDNFFEMRQQLHEIEDEIREVRPKAAAARLLQPMIEDVPVISRAKAGEINSLATPEAVRGYKDISGFMGQVRDVYRNFQAVFGDAYPAVKKAILDPFDAAKGDMVDTIRSLGDDLEEKVIKKFDIARGSKESAAVQRYGDSSLDAGYRMSRDDLVKEFGRETADKIVDADSYFRTKYNELIESVNKARADIYPNDPTKLIPKRKDYYRHFQELGDGFKEIMEIFETPAGIDPHLAGLSEWTKPKSKFLSFAQQRLGKSTSLDAVGGFIDYVPSYSFAVHMDPHIGNFRYLRRQLSEFAPTPGVRELVPAADEAAAAAGAKDLVKQPGINNFLEYLDDFANNLAGKTNPLDRWIQKVVPGGRKTFKALNWVNSRVKSNTILGNLSSAVAQIFNVPQGIASAKLYSIPGIRRTLGDFAAKIYDKGLETPIDSSSFIKERYREDLASRFPIDIVDHPVKGSIERSKAFAAWTVGALDEVGTKFIWNAHYAKALGEGAADPIKYADDITREMVAGRGVGEVPLVQQSKVFQLIAPFQLEVGNLWYVMGGFVKRKDFGALATLMVANYLMNRAAVEVRGSPVVFDPIEAMIDGATQAHDEMKDTGNASRAALKFLGRNVGEILSNLPLGQTVAEAISDDFIKKDLGIQGGKKELFGSADPGRFGGGLLAVSSLADPFAKLLSPFGGSQIEKTIGGIEAMASGEVKDKSGQLSYTVKPTVSNVLKAVLFGKNATAEAQAYFDTQDDLFSRQYRQTESRTDLTMDAESKWADIKKLGSPAEKVAALQQLDQDDPDLSDAVYQVAQDEAAGLNGNERMVQMLGVDNGERAKYIVDQVQGLKTPAEKAAFLQSLDDKVLIPDKVFDQVAALMKSPGDPPTVSDGKHKTSDVLDTVITYAEALGTDPATAFNRIFTGQKILRVDNGAIVVQRMTLQASEAEAKAQGDNGVPGVNGFNLDHTIPLELGGSNAKSNLKLVPEATWASYTPVENYLGDILRSKKGSKQQVQDAITKFKSGQETFEQIQKDFGVPASSDDSSGDVSINLPAPGDLDKQAQGTRGVRNNNPLNLKASPTTLAFNGVAGVDPQSAADGGQFLRFNTPEDGIDGAKKLLTSDVYSGLTVNQALEKWSNKGYGGAIVPEFAAKKVDDLSPAELNAVVLAMINREGNTA